MKPPRRYRPLFSLGKRGGTEAEAEMDREIESHLAMRTADLVRAGLPPETARDEAMRRFGNFDTARVQLHSAARQRDAALRQRDWIGSIVADFRYAMRQVTRAPGSSLLAVATLALGIGATTAMFTLVDRVLLRPLPFRSPEQLVALSGADSAHNAITTVSSDDWLDWQQSKTLDGSAIYGIPYREGILTPDSSTRVSAVRASGNYFRVLGARFLVGRPFTEAEARQRALVVVVSERLWRQMAGSDPRLVIPIRTAIASFTIVGVVAAGQEFPTGTDVWFPVAPRPGQPRVNINWFAIGRMRPPATIDQVHAEMGTIARRIRAGDPTALYDYDVQVQPLAQTIVGDVSTYLMMLMGVVLLVLLIVCANVAASGLARGAARSREMAIRTSLGAVRGRLIQQLLIEHVWLGLVAGGIGLFIGWAAIRGVVSVWGNQIPRAPEVAIDGRVFLFAFAVSVLAGVVAGVIPALRVTRVSLSSMMASGGRTAAKGGRNLAGSSLVSLEIALALVLLTGAGLLIRSFRSVLGRDIGFDTNVASAEVGLSGPTYSTDSLRRYAYWSALIDSYEGIPGVQGAAVTNWIPLGLTAQGFIDVEGNNDTGAGAVYRTVSRDFFLTLRMPRLLGRTFGASDNATSQRVVVINRTMADRYWPGTSPIGKRVKARSMEPGPTGAAWLTIIGVVGDVRTYGLESDARAEMYVDFEQTPSWTYTMTAIVRGSVPATQLLGEMRRRAHQIDPRTAIDPGTLTDRLRRTLATRVLTMSLLTGFAGIALLLAALGIYGVLSYAVAQRTRELAVRAALGARRGQLLGLVFGEGLRVLSIGMAFGIAGAFGLTRLLDAMLVGVHAIDPVSYVASVAVLFVVAVVAIMGPALRATRLDPMIALQAE
jgi:putative ABC transport system permease protein